MKWKLSVVNGETIDAHSRSIGQQIFQTFLFSFQFNKDLAFYYVFLITKYVELCSWQLTLAVFSAVKSKQTV